jgi:alpha-amylase
MACLILTWLTLAAAHSAQEWASRSIYQLLTDRFARPDGDSTECKDLKGYCGGGFLGIANNLDYIQGMGFDAIWISPIVSNTEGGYHGYWTQDFYKLNSHFGTDQDFRDLVSALHSRGMWIMVDVVANHVGPIGLESVEIIEPFNHASYYHPYCDIDWGSTQSMENCWLFDLPDLDQSNEFVRTSLLSWIKDLVETWDIDGLRIDTCLHVPKWFMQQFAESAGVYTLCECCSGDVHSNAPYTQGVVDATLNFPLYMTMQRTLLDSHSMYSFRDYIAASQAYSNLNWLGNFADNHDVPRFLSKTANVNKFRTALVIAVTWPGIPVIYYGDEQGFRGGNDPLNRETMWSHLDVGSPLYSFVATLIKGRKHLQLWREPFVERSVKDDFYAFSRGKTLVVVTNSDSTRHTVTYHPYRVGEVVCSLIDPEDCIPVTASGLTISLNAGQPNIYLPVASEGEVLLSFSTSRVSVCRTKEALSLQADLNS